MKIHTEAADIRRAMGKQETWPLRQEKHTEINRKTERYKHTEREKDTNIQRETERQKERNTQRDKRRPTEGGRATVARNAALRRREG